MLNRLRGLLVPLVVLSLAVGGLAYAAADDNSPVDLVQDTAEDLPESDDGVVQDDEATEPESDDDDGVTTTDDGIVDDVIDDAAPTADEEESHGPERSTEGCPEGFSGNHGQFVSESDDEHPRSDAAHSPCGKPVHEDESEDDDGASGDDEPADSDD